MQRILMMQIDSIFRDEKGVETIHYDAADGIDYTLCGIGIEEDERYPDESFTPTTKRVNCKNCISIRNHVLGKGN